MKHKSDIEIGWRAAEEGDRIFPTRREAARRLGADRKLVTNWANSTSSPSTLMIARLYYAGADVIYILTGRRTK